MVHRSNRMAPAVLAALVAIPSTVLAQAVPPAAVPRPPEVPTVPPSTRPLEIAPPPRPALPADSTVSVQVDRFDVSGNTLIDRAAIDGVLAPFTGRTLGFAELNAATEAVTALYRKRGWLLALAYLPAQEIRNGTVEIAILEGQLGKLQVKSAPGLDASFVEASAGWRLTEGKVVGEANLVRNLLVLNDQPGLAVSADVHPGAAVGTADVDVDVVRTGNRVGGSVVLDNYGTRFTGRNRIGANLDIRQLAGRGDELDIQALGTEEGGEQSLLLNYAIPVHPSGTRLGVAVSGVEYQIVDPALRALQAHGRALTAQIGLDQPLYRRPDYALGLHAALIRKDLRDHLDSVPQHDDRHIDQIQIGMRGLWRPQPAVPGGTTRTTSWSINVTAGDVHFDDAGAANNDAATLRTAGGYVRFNIDASHEQPLSDRWSLLGRLALQAANKNLDAAERVLIGGANALRPFGDRPASADEVETTSKTKIDRKSRERKERPFGHISHTL